MNVSPQKRPENRKRQSAQAVRNKTTQKGPRSHRNLLLDKLGTHDAHAHKQHLPHDHDHTAQPGEYNVRQC